MTRTYISWFLCDHIQVRGRVGALPARENPGRHHLVPANEGRAAVTPGSRLAFTEMRFTDLLYKTGWGHHT
jgi:hypothetical protein